MADYNLKQPSRPDGLLKAVEKLIYWSQISIPAVYGEELVYADIQAKMADKVNEVVEQLNVNTAWTQYLLDEGVEAETITYINELIQNGTMSSVINNELLGEINAKLAGKRDTTYLIQPGDLSPETLKLITGGAVAVVGNNGVFQQAIKDNNVSYYKTDFLSDGINIYNPNDPNIATGYYVNPANGELIANAVYRTSGFIKVKGGVNYSLRQYNDNGNPIISGANYTIRFVAYYDDEYVIQTDSSLKKVTTNMANPIKDGYIRLSYNITQTVLNRLMVIPNKTNLQYPINFKEFNINGDNIIINGDNIEDSTVNYTKTDFIKTGNNLYNGKYTEGYYVNYTNGFLLANQLYSATEYIPVKKGDHLNTSYSHMMAYYDKNKIYLTGVDSRTTSIPDAPEDGYARLTLPFTPSSNTMINVGPSLLPYEPYKLYLVTDSASPGPEPVNIPAPILSSTVQSNVYKESGFTLNNSTKNSTIDYQEMANYIINFKGFFNTFTGTLGVGKGNNSGYGSIVEINANNISITTFDSSGKPTTPVTFAHGLTLKDYINVNIKNNYGSVVVELMTNGGIFKTSQTISWLGYKGTINCYSTGTLTSCEVSYFCNKWKSINHIYGDSYLSLNSGRWPYYLYNNGYENYLLNGYGGRNSSAAYTSFQKSLQYTTPQNLIWALGMNDGDSASAVNATWNSTFNTLKNYCADNGINFIPCTIPTTPTVNNNFKNAIVRASGLPYIDFAKGVGASDSGVWFEGMLSSDNVHPTNEGAKALASQAMNDFPLLTSTNKF